MRLEGKTVFITGAGGGIGSAAARRCAEAGARVVVTDVDRDGAEETASAIHEEGGDAVVHAFDVTDADRFEDCVTATADEYGLDVLVNRAGLRLVASRGYQPARTTLVSATRPPMFKRSTRASAIT